MAGGCCPYIVQYTRYTRLTLFLTLKAAAAERKRAARVSPRAVSPVETFAPLPRSMSKVYDSRNDQIHDARRHAFAVSEVSKKKQQRELSERAFDGDAREVSARVTDRADARGKDATELPPLEKWNDFKMTQKKHASPDESPGPGSYDLLGTRKHRSGSGVTRSCSGSFRSESARFKASHTPGPGPGYYDPNKPGTELVKKSFNATINGIEFTDDD
jgi:hypothetical protein